MTVSTPTGQLNASGGRGISIDQQPLVIEPQSTQAIEIGLSTVRLLIPAEATNGQMSMLEYVAQPGFAGPPLHRHPDYDEVFWVLEGTASLRIDERTVSADAGAGVYVPGHVAHSFSNATRRELRMLITLTPGGFERYFDELAQLVSDDGTPDAQAVSELWNRYGLLPATDSPRT